MAVFVVERKDKKTWEVEDCCFTYCDTRRRRIWIGWWISFKVKVPMARLLHGVNDICKCLKAHHARRVCVNGLAWPVKRRGV